MTGGPKATASTSPKPPRAAGIGMYVNEPALPEGHSPLCANAALQIRYRPSESRRIVIMKLLDMGVGSSPSGVIVPLATPWRKTRFPLSVSDE